MVPKILLGLEAIFPEADISYIFTFFRHFSTVFSRSKSHRTPTTPFHTLSPHITIQSHPAALPQFTCLLYIYRFIVAPAVSTGHWSFTEKREKREVEVGKKCRVKKCTIRWEDEERRSSQKKCRYTRWEGEEECGYSERAQGQTQKQQELIWPDNTNIYNNFISFRYRNCFSFASDISC